MMIFSETQDFAETRDVVNMSVRSEIRLYRQFLNRVFFCFPDEFLTRFALDSMGREVDMSRFRGALNKCVNLLDSTDNCLRPAQN